MDNLIRSYNFWRYIEDLRLSFFSYLFIFSWHIIELRDLHIISQTNLTNTKFSTKNVRKQIKKLLFI